MVKLFIFLTKPNFNQKPNRCTKKQKKLKPSIHIILFQQSFSHKHCMYVYIVFACSRSRTKPTPCPSHASPSLSVPLLQLHVYSFCSLSVFYIFFFFVNSLSVMFHAKGLCNFLQFRL